MPTSVQVESGMLQTLARSRSTLERDLASYLGGRDFDLRIVGRLAPGAKPADLDLLHVPKGRRLDQKNAADFAARSTAGTAGIYLGGVGLHPVGPPEVMARQYRENHARFDLTVYDDGATCRKVTSHAEDVPLPSQIYLGLTQACNRSCSFCVSRSFAPDVLSFDTVREIVEAVRGHVKVIALTGAGEAMVHPQFWEILDFLHEQLPNVQFKMNTSGVTLRKASARLVAKPFRNITVSLNAANPSSYKKVVGGNLQVVVDGARELAVQRVRANALNLRLTASMVLMKSTLPEFPDFISLVHSLGFEEVQGIYLMINGMHHAHESPWHDPDRSNEYLQLARERAERLGISIRLPPLFKRREFRDATQQSSLPESQGQACVEPWSTTYVRPNGDLIPCPYSERATGNLLTDGLVNAWKAADYRELRDRLASGTPPAMCRHCCGFNETGRVDDYRSHWIGDQEPPDVAPESCVHAAVPSQGRE